MKTIFKIATVALAAAAAMSSHADSNYPVAGKTITIIVPFTAGGPTDITSSFAYGCWGGSSTIYVRMCLVISAQGTPTATAAGRRMLGWRSGNQYYTFYDLFSDPARIYSPEAIKTARCPRRPGWARSRFSFLVLVYVFVLVYGDF